MKPFSKPKKVKLKGETYKIIIKVLAGWPDEMCEKGILGVTRKTKPGEYEIVSINLAEPIAHELGHVVEDMLGYEESEELPEAFEDLMKTKGRERFRNQRAYSHSLILE